MVSELMHRACMRRGNGEPARRTPALPRKLYSLHVVLDKCTPPSNIRTGPGARFALSCAAVAVPHRIALSCITHSLVLLPCASP